VNNGDAIDFRRLLRQSCARTRRRTSNQRNELPPLHYDPAEFGIRKFQSSSPPVEPTCNG